jgi:hypothetical protein
MLSVAPVMAGGVKEPGPAQTAPLNPFYTGDGGKGMSLAILAPKATGLAENQGYIPYRINTIQHYQGFVDPYQPSFLSLSYRKNIPPQPPNSLQIKIPPNHYVLLTLQGINMKGVRKMKITSSDVVKGYTYILTDTFS